MFGIAIAAMMCLPAQGAERLSKAEDGACQRSAFRVVVDVGHTVDSPGADSARGVTEYSYNLQLADAVKQALVGAGFDKTMRMVTSTRSLSGLLERAERANSLRADLFISIHHDSVPDGLIQKWEYDGQQHQYCDRFKGYSIFVSRDNADCAGSIEFGHLLGAALQERGLHYTPHYTLALMGRHRHELLDYAAGVYRYDQLVVLRYTRMPAVLLEAGSIVNRAEEIELAKPERRAVTAAAVASAVEGFCTAQALARADNKRKPQPSVAAGTSRAKAASTDH